MENLYEDRNGWYHKKFNWAKEEEELVVLRFDGIYMDSRIYVNGVQADGNTDTQHLKWTFVTEYVKDGGLKSLYRLLFRLQTAVGIPEPGFIVMYG